MAKAIHHVGHLLEFRQTPMTPVQQILNKFGIALVLSVQNSTGQAIPTERKRSIPTEERKGNPVPKEAVTFVFREIEWTNPERAKLQQNRRNKAPEERLIIGLRRHEFRFTPQSKVFGGYFAH